MRKSGYFKIKLPRKYSLADSISLNNLFVLKTSESVK